MNVFGGKIAKGYDELGSYAAALSDYGQLKQAVHH
jgi:hypothetical protein